MHFHELLGLHPLSVSHLSAGLRDIFFNQIMQRALEAELYLFVSWHRPLLGLRTSDQWIQSAPTHGRPGATQTAGVRGSAGQALNQQHRASSVWSPGKEKPTKTVGRGESPSALGEGVKLL